MSGRRSRAWLGATIAALSMLAPGTASGAAFPVETTDDGEDAVPGDGVCSTLVNPRCTLRAAIEESNALAGPDQVNLPPGTYTLGPLGDLSVSSNIVIEGTGTSSNTHIRPAVNGRIFTVSLAGRLDLRDATVRNGFLAADGGGILSQGTLTLRRVVVANNEANNESGGGIAIDSPASGSTTILDSTIGATGSLPGNRAGGPGATTALGGAILHEDGILTIRDSTIAGNRVDATPGSGTPTAAGGGVFAGGGLVVADSTIRSNLARASGIAQAGGVVSTDGALTMRRSTVAQNRAVPLGAPAETAIGGIWNVGPGLIEDSTIANNTADLAAGIGHTPSSPSQSLTVRRSAVTRNVTEGITAGGPIVLESSTLSSNGAGPGLRMGLSASAVVRGATIAGHGSNGGLVSSGATISVNSSILSGNSPNCREQSGGAIVSGGFNVDQASSCGFTATGDQANTNPLLGPLASNGGPTRTHSIARDSPARDAVTSGCPPPATDQRGVRRPQGPACDSGAFEFDPEAPKLELDGKAKQRAKKLKLDVSCGPEPCSVQLGGKAKVPTRSAVTAKAKKLKLKPKGVDVATEETETVRLKFRKNRKAVRKINALLKRGGKKARKRSKVTVDATATGAGGTDTARQKIKLKR